MMATEWVPDTPRKVIDEIFEIALGSPA